MSAVAPKATGIATRRSGRTQGANSGGSNQNRVPIVDEPMAPLELRVSRRLRVPRGLGETSI
jgi:hypothetical protein